MHRNPVRLAVASVRLIGLALHIAYAMAVACVYPLWGLERQSRFRQHWSRGLLRLLHVRCKADSARLAVDAPGAFLVANHISWLDVFVIKAQRPTHFVAKAEVGQWPLLGWLVRRSGTLLVRRERRTDTRIVNQQIMRLLQRGQSVVVFAQGTSTPATQPVHFHASLLQSAIDAQAAVHPVVVYYHDALGRPLDTADFVGDTSFGQSLWRIVCAPYIQVTVQCLPAIDVAGHNRRSLAAQAQQSVRSTLSAWVQANDVLTVTQMPSK